MVNAQQISLIVSIYIPHDDGIHADSIQKMIWKRLIRKEWQKKVVLPFCYHFYLVIYPGLKLSKSGKVAENLDNTAYALRWGCRGRGFESRCSDQFFSTS